MICITCAYEARASHIIGGEMYYEYLGTAGEGMHRYKITLKLFRVCESGGNLAIMPPSVFFTFFNNETNQEIAKNLSPQKSFDEKQSAQTDPCIVNPPRVCFQIGTYETTVTLAENDQGYTVAFQSCCRDPNMENIVDIRGPNGNPPGNGSTYFTQLPGRNSGLIGSSSPVFDKDEAVLVCANKKFTYDFSATDPDGDRLEYEFCDAYTGGATTDQSGIPPAAIAPPYGALPYRSPYSGGQPLGIDAVINPNTGMISGNAPSAGKYVVTVCVKEYRGSKLISTHFKDFHMNVTTCVKLVTAAMPEKYADCDGYTINFLNNSTPGKTYYWDFGDGTDSATTSLEPLKHTYQRDSTYTVKLYVDRSSNCGDSATAMAYVYPLLQASFEVDGLCSNTTSHFLDKSGTSNGSDDITYRRWDFGVNSVTSDTSLLASPDFKYPGPGDYPIQLQIRTLKGCERTVNDTITVYDKPPLTVTGDTMVCYKDELQLQAESTVNGSYAWTPGNYFITGANTATPVVRPKTDTSYEVTFTDGTGCTNTAKVSLDVKDTILVHTSADSTVCTGDQLQLHATADGPYQFSWLSLPDNSVISNTSDAVVTPPPPNASYTVQVTLGSCTSRDTINFRMVDPPEAYAGEDTTICYGDKVTLEASGGTSYQWTPEAGLTAPTESTTIANPKTSTDFVVTVTDTLGCPKPVSDSVYIGVIPPVPAFAGNDTIVIKDQPFQLHATGGAQYVWTPVEGLNNPNIADPVTNINRDVTYIVTVTTEEGCFATDDIHVRFMTGPEIYIPTGFSPNGDGQNDVFRPLPVGILKTDFFRVFDRWGRLMYASTEYMKGWDGTVKGNQASIGTYVWVIQGQDINGKTLLYKGTVTLLR